MVCVSGTGVRCNGHHGAAVVNIMRTVQLYELSVQKDFIDKIVRRIIEDLHHKDEVRYADYLNNNVTRQRKPVENAFNQLIRNKTVKNIRRGFYGKGPNWGK